MKIGIIRAARRRVETGPSAKRYAHLHQKQSEMMLLFIIQNAATMSA